MTTNDGTIQDIYDESIYMLSLRALSTGDRSEHLIRYECGERARYSKFQCVAELIIYTKLMNHLSMCLRMREHNATHTLSLYLLTEI